MDTAWTFYISQKKPNIAVICARFCIPPTVFKRRIKVHETALKGLSASSSPSSSSTLPSSATAPLLSQGVKPDLSADLELRLCDYIVEMVNSGFGLAIKDVKRIAVQIALVQGNKAFQASSGWWRNFVSRHPFIAKRRAESFDRMRVRGKNKERVRRYFEMIGQCIKKLEALNGRRLSPDLIGNFDETGVQLRGSAGYVVALRGSKNVHRFTDTNRVTTTIVSCVWADGSAVPPFYILKVRGAGLCQF